tara:strand:+ start:621 stop:1127 length:507 start_codon:yes stop_codon:yes gene_type:complete
MALSNVEELRPLLAFAQMIRDPAAFQDTLKRVETDLTQYDKMLKVYPTVKAADDYFAKAKAYVDESNAIIASKQTEFDMARAAWLSDKLSQEAALESRRQVFEKKERELKDRDRELVASENSLKAKVKIVEQLKQDVSTEKQNLETSQAQVKEQLERLRKASAALETA